MASFDNAVFVTHTPREGDRAMLGVTSPDVTEAVVIFVVVVLNAWIGFRPEYSAEKAMASLQWPRRWCDRRAEVLSTACAAAATSSRRCRSARRRGVQPILEI